MKKFTNEQIEAMGKLISSIASWNRIYKEADLEDNTHRSFFLACRLKRELQLLDEFGINCIGDPMQIETSRSIVEYHNLTMEKAS
jgi:hypothetical protein